MKPLPPRDPLRPCEHETLMEDEVEMEGPTAVDPSIDNNHIRNIASTMLMSGELVEGSRIKAVEEEMFYVVNYAFCYRKGVVVQLCNSLFLL
jgi:hypothetical protein